MNRNNYDELGFVAKYQRIPYYPVAFKSGNGALLYDYNDKEYIDFLSSATSANLGHGNKEVADAVYEQMCNITQYTCAYFQMKEAMDLAEKLTSLTGRENMQVSYSTTGSEAIDNAIKVARAYTKRSKIVSFAESYHGSTYGAQGNFPVAVSDYGEFLGWYTSGDSERQITDSTIVDETAKDLVLYAKWDEEPAYAIFFKENKLLYFGKGTAPTTYSGEGRTAFYQGIEALRCESEEDVPWNAWKFNIEKVIIDKKISPVSTAYWFYCFLYGTDIDLTNLDTSRTEDMKYMFYRVADTSGVESFEIKGLDKLNTSNVKDMSYMFFECDMPDDFTLGNRFDTSNVKDMGYMFSGCDMLDDFTLGDKFDTSNVVDMGHILDIGNRRAVVGYIRDHRTSIDCGIEFIGVQFRLLLLLVGRRCRFGFGSGIRLTAGRKCHRQQDQSHIQ